MDGRSPIKQVYMTCNCDTGQRMWDVMPTVQAVEGDRLFTLSERGILTVTPECTTIYTPSATGHFRYQIPGDTVWSAAMLEKIRTFNKIHKKTHRRLFAIFASKLRREVV